MLAELELNIAQGHRQRLRQKFLNDKLSDSEELELLLAYVIPRRDVKLLARNLLKKYGNLYQILTASIADLESNNGIGNNVAIFIKLLSKIMMSSYTECMKNSPVFYDEVVIFNYCKLLMDNKNIEEFHVLYLDNSKHLIRDVLHSCGTIDWAAVYPREILKTALNLNADSVILLHNHPASDSLFSAQDIKLTNTIQDLLQPMNITVYDHFLISGGKIYSAKNLHLIK